MDFDIPDDVRDLQERTREFVRNEVMPLERRQAPTSTGRATNCARSSSPGRAPRAS